MKISVIMQSYLGDYPGSRKDPKNKLIRAISSFLKQKHPDKELIICSDGCEDTKKIYDLFFADNKQIKFCYISKNKDTSKMYETKDNNTSYRGVPRRLGNSIADGDIVTYFDSDDIMLPNRLSDLADFWQNVPHSIKWASNPLRYLHVSSLQDTSNIKNNFELSQQLINLKDYGYTDQQFFLNCSVPQGMVSCASYAISHRKNVSAIWRDTEIIRNLDGNIISGTSEDTDFLAQLDTIDGSGLRQESASIVICHYRNLWDV